MAVADFTAAGDSLVAGLGSMTVAASESAEGSAGKPRFEAAVDSAALVRRVGATRFTVEADSTAVAGRAVVEASMAVAAGTEADAGNW
jgi:hypothetical protein